MSIFTKNINIWAPWNFLKIKNFDVRAPTSSAISCQNFGFGLLKSYLTFGYLTCYDQSKKISHSTLFHNIWYMFPCSDHVRVWRIPPYIMHSSCSVLVRELYVLFHNTWYMFPCSVHVRVLFERNWTIS